MITLLLGAVLKILLNLYLTPQWGIEGAAWATNIDFGIAAVANLYILYRSTSFTISFLEIGKILFSSLAMGGGTVMFYNFMSTILSNTMSVAVSILLGIVLYVLALSITKTMQVKEFTGLAKQAMKKGGSK